MPVAVVKKRGQTYHSSFPISSRVRLGLFISFHCGKDGRGAGGVLTSGGLQAGTCENVAESGTPDSLVFAKQKAALKKNKIKL